MPLSKKSLQILIVLAGITLVTVACGIGTEEARREPLWKMRVTGTPVVGQEMRLELDYRQTYDVAVDVECDLKRGGEVIQQIGYGTVSANPNGRPNATPATGTLSFPFRPNKAGSYSVACFTVRDAENKLTSSLTIKAK